MSAYAPYEMRPYALETGTGREDRELAEYLHEEFTPAEGEDLRLRLFRGIRPSRSRIGAWLRSLRAGGATP